MPIYTRFGDNGYTSLFGGVTLPKDHDIFNTIGSIDELNSLIGLLRSIVKDNEINAELKMIQNKLTDINTEIVSRYLKKTERYEKYFITEEDVTNIEKIIDKYEQRLPKLKKFILYSGALEATLSYYIRSVCRRAERNVVSFFLKHDIKESYVIPYINRLSDLLFIYGRYLNHLRDIDEEFWEG